MLLGVLFCCFFFFLQAEDGIRDYKVTGVQTCALPIYIRQPSWWDGAPRMSCGRTVPRSSCPIWNGAADVMRPDSAAQFLSDLERVVQAPGSQSRGAYCHLDAAGGARWLEGILTDRLEDPAIQAIVYNCRDVTNSTLAEPKLALLAAIVESSGWAIVSQDFDGRVLTWNPGAVELYGYTAEEIVGN